MIEDWQMPRRATRFSAGYDFVAPEDYDINPGEVTYIDTGVKLVDIHKGITPMHQEWFMMLAPRSSLGFKYGMRFLNTVGIADMDFPETIKASVTSDVPFTLSKGDRFMQGIVIPYLRFSEEIPPKRSRNGGIGSTGQ